MSRRTPDAPRRPRGRPPRHASGPMRQTSLWLPPETAGRLRALSARYGITLGDVIELLLDEYGAPADEATTASPTSSST